MLLEAEPLEEVAAEEGMVRAVDGGLNGRVVEDSIGCGDAVVRRDEK